MQQPLTINPDTLERATRRRYGDVRRWRPIDPDPATLVALHEPSEIRVLRGSGWNGLAKIAGLEPRRTGYDLLAEGGEGDR